MSECVYDDTKPLPVKYLHPILLNEISGWKHAFMNMQTFGGVSEFDPVFLTDRMVQSFEYYLRLAYYIVIDRTCRTAYILEEHPNANTVTTAQAKHIWSLAGSMDSEMKQMGEGIQNANSSMGWNARLLSSLQKLHQDSSLLFFLLGPNDVISQGWEIFVLLTEQQPVLPPTPLQLAVQQTSCITAQIERLWSESSKSFYDRVLIPLHQDDWKTSKTKRRRSGCKSDDSDEDC